jgi:hypothetical protein
MLMLRPSQGALLRVCFRCNGHATSASGDPKLGGDSLKDTRGKIYTG